MRRTLCLAALVGTVMMTMPGLTPAANASYRGGFFFGGAFRIGGLPFVVAFAQPGYSHHHGYYYRTSARLAYRGYGCSSACFRDGGYYYHSRSCPVVHRHLAYYGVDDGWIEARYWPRYDGYYGYDGYDGYYGGYYGYDGYGRSYGYDRYDRRRHDDGYYGGRYGHNAHDGRYYGNRHHDDRYDRRHDRDHSKGHGKGRGHRNHSHHGSSRPYGH